MINPKTTIEQNKEIISLYLEGNKPKHLQKKYNISSATFYKILKDNNIQSNQRVNISETNKIAIGEAYKNGKSAERVGILFNVVESTVLRICRELGIEIRAYTDRGMSFVLSEKEKENIINLYKENVGPKEIGKLYNIDNSTILRLLKKLKIPRSQLKKLTKNEIDYIILHYKDGESSEKIAKDLKIDPVTVCRQLTKNNIVIREAKYNHRKYEIDYTWLDNINSEEKAYFLGLLWSDGNINKRDNTIKITLLYSDRDILDKLSDIIFGKSCVSIDNQKGGTFKTAALRIYSKDFKDKLAEYGCLPNKGQTIQYPSFLSEELHRHFIRGLIDGDGCLSFNGKIQVSLAGNKFITNSFKDILLERSIASKIFTSKKKNGEYYSAWVYRKEDVYKTLTWLYNDSTIYLDRKYNKYLFLRNQLIKNKVPFKYGTDKTFVYNNVIFSKENIKRMTLEEKQEALKHIFNYFRVNGFPYPIYENEVLEKEWVKLCKIKTDNLLKNNIIANNLSLRTGGKIWKHFADHYYNASDGKKPSIFQAFNNDELLEKAISNRLGITYKDTYTINGNAIKQALKVSHLASQISVFNSVIAKLIYDKYTKPNDTVYDFSIGFGQRLLGAMSSQNNLTYVGVDPWTDVSRSIKNIAKFIRKTNKCELYRIGAEKFCPQDMHGTIDFAFSSPPYYDIEIYENHRSQANIGRTYDEFINDWWLKVVQNIYKLLKPEGKIALNMKQIILNDMQNILCNNGFKYVETLYIRSSRKHMKNKQEYVDEPIAIFEKV